MSRASTAEGTVLVSRRFPRLYRDSVALMAIASSTEQLDGVTRVGAVMATPANLAILEESQMRPGDLTAGPDDLVIVVRGDTDEIAAAALDEAERALTSVESSGGPRDEQQPGTVREGLAAALAGDPDRPANLVAISVPGDYAPVVAEQAIRSGLHVFCFSDNVRVDDEVRLKRLAIEHGVLHMGPDCGTAIIDGTPLGFANVVRTGPVGIVAASGTGAQEVSRLLHLAGTGVSNLIGVGGRDLSAEVGGLMSEAAIDLLHADPATTVIAVVSKPPAPEVAQRLLAKLAGIAREGTAVVACFLGVDDGEQDGVQLRGTLEGGAIAAAEAAGAALVVEDPAAPEHTGGRVLGLFAGGTLASEAKLILGRAGVDAVVLDLGDDEYTAGRPHPMIDPASRAERIVAAAGDPGVGVLLLDLVLGYGASADPATPVVDAVAEAREVARGRELVVIASVCGTDGDPQGLSRQAAALESAGILLAPTNASAARLAAAAAGAGT